MSFYSSNLVISLWWLNTDSYLIARPRILDLTSSHDPIRLLIRRLAVLLSMVLGVVYLTYTTVMQSRHWDSEKSGACYRYNDHTPPWLWIPGTIFHAIVLALIIIPKTRLVVGRYRDKTSKWCTQLWDALYEEKKGLKHLKFKFQNNKFSFYNLQQYIIGVCRVIFAAALFAMYWLGLNFVSVWGFGDGHPVLFTLLYFLVVFQDSYDVISMKVLNKSLILGDESAMSFGQILPLVLLIQIFIAAVDAWRVTHGKHKCQCGDKHGKEIV